MTLQWGRDQPSDITHWYQKDDPLWWVMVICCPASWLCIQNYRRRCRLPESCWQLMWKMCWKSHSCIDFFPPLWSRDLLAPHRPLAIYWFSCPLTLLFVGLVKQIKWGSGGLWNAIKPTPPSRSECECESGSAAFSNLATGHKAKFRRFWFEPRWVANRWPNICLDRWGRWDARSGQDRTVS